MRSCAGRETVCNTRYAKLQSDDISSSPIVNTTKRKRRDRYNGFDLINRIRFYFTVIFYPHVLKIQKKICNIKHRFNFHGCYRFEGPSALTVFRRPIKIIVLSNGIIKNILKPKGFGLANIKLYYYRNVVEFLER